MKKLLYILTLAILSPTIFPITAKAVDPIVQSPSSAVSTTTTGGTNINYQTNNSYNNEFGFAPGIFCRTPTLVLGASSGLIQQATKDDPYIATDPTPYSYSYNDNLNINATLGFVMPIGSSAIEDCKALAKQIALDRQISSQLSMIRACASLEKENIKIDPLKYPLLAICVQKPGINLANKKIQYESPLPASTPTSPQPLDPRSIRGLKGT